MWKFAELLFLTYFLEQQGINLMQKETKRKQKETKADISFLAYNLCKLLSWLE